MKNKDGKSIVAFAKVMATLKTIATKKQDLSPTGQKVRTHKMQWLQLSQEKGYVPSLVRR